LIVISLLKAHSTETAATTEGAIPITPGASIIREIAAGAKEEFAITVDHAQLLHFSIDKGDLLLSTELYGPTNTKLFESASQDFEVVDISFPAETAGTYRIEIKSREGETGHSYELKLYGSTPLTTVSRKDSEAHQAFGRAEVLRTKWTEASLREAIAEFDKAASTWITTGNLSKASQAKLKSGDLCFSLSEYEEAADRYETAAALGARTGDRRGEARALSQLGLLQSYLGDNGRAQNHINKALNLLGGCEANTNADIKNACATALSNQAEVIYAKGYLLKSARQLERVVELFADDRKGRAKVHLFAGNIAGTLGYPDKAMSEISQASALYKVINNRSGEGLALIALGLTHSLRRDEDGALKLYRDASDVFLTIGNRHSQAIALNALGQAYENLKKYQFALSNYESALRLSEQAGAVDLVTVTMSKVATMHNVMGHFDQALAFYEQSLKLSRAAGKVRTEANALREIAQIYDAQGHTQQALQQYRGIQAFYESIGDRQVQALILNSEGDVLVRLGQTKQALEVFGKALSLSEKLGDRGIVIDTLFNLARAHQKAGNLEIALSFIERSIRDIEDLRRNVGSPDFRASYFSGVQQHYKLGIEILMQLDEATPGQGFAVEAFLMSDKSRARLLVDLLTESRAALREGATADLLARERALRDLLRVRVQSQWNSTPSNANSAETTEAAAEMTQLRLEYEEVQSQLRKQNPHLTSLVQSAPLNLEQIQHELRDDTLLLQYELGKERSYLWAVTSNSFQCHRLPAGKIIEDAAHEVYKLMTARQGFEGKASRDYRAEIEAADKLLDEKGSSLSQMLLGSVAEELKNRRLLLVTEGALQYVPLDALPVPKTVEPSDPRLTLADTNEIVGTASMSTLVAIRNAREAKRSPRKVVAVIADPVFSPHDDRVQNEGPATVRTAAWDQSSQGSASQTSENALRGGEFVRLAHASEEADAISAAAPQGTSLVAKGFDASRETAMDPQIGEYQIVHFATHGLLDSQNPGSSGIVLTMVDRNGTTKNGVMALPDIYSLDLSAELTVLSACQSALGKDIKGEGFVGLTHSFMAAGSKSVVASLWKVDDRATAALMRQLYKSMLQKGMTPAAALRAAKLEIRREKQWSAPYYWAGFVLQGEYTNRISVESHSWVRSGLLCLSFLVLISSGLILLRKRRRQFFPAKQH